MASRSVQLRVGGQTYRVVSSADEEELGRLAAVVDAKLAAVVPPGRAITPQALLLAAMALAHELEEERERGRATALHARDAVGRILERVDAALGTNGATSEAGGVHTHAVGIDGHAELAAGTGGAAGWRDPGTDDGRERPLVERRGAPDRRELSALVDRRDPPTRPSGRS
jgi:cell division protein ZapA